MPVPLNEGMGKIFIMPFWPQHCSFILQVCDYKPAVNHTFRGW